jgi:tetratricopeptide (TPR) repeat protein
MVGRSVYLSVLLIVLIGQPANAGWIGITIQDYASEGGSVRGIKVVDAGKGTPGARAGLEAGDVILSANGIPVGSVQDLVKIVRETTIGRPIEMRVLRKETILSLAPIVSEPPRGIADYELGLENFQKGLYDQATIDFTKALGVDPGMATAYFYRAQAYEKQGNMTRPLQITQGRSSSFPDPSLRISTAVVSIKK